MYMLPTSIPPLDPPGGDNTLRQEKKLGLIRATEIDRHTKIKREIDRHTKIKRERERERERKRERVCAR